jgi:acetyl esterase/lipase
VHGGAWTSGNRFAAQRADRALAEALGMVVVAIDFRLAPADPYPAMLQDLNFAVRWIKAHADELGGSADRLGAIGWSSGGHMAVLAALKPQDPRYAAIPNRGPTEVDGRLAYVVACWPPLDPLERYRFARATNRWDLVRNTEGCFGDEVGMYKASAERVVREGEASDMPPLLIVQGTADANIPLPMIKRFAETYRSAGGDVQLEVFDGQPHNFISKPREPVEDAVQAMDVITQFIREHAIAR